MKDLLTLIITGLSGAGKTTALRAVEDLGFYCVDNLPPPLLEQFVEAMKAEPEVDRIALVADARLRSHIGGYVQAIDKLTRRGDRLELVYLDARDEVLVRRFSKTRRRHPLGGDDLPAGLQKERDLLDPLRHRATKYLDTSDLTVHQLKQALQKRYGEPGRRTLEVSISSFGFQNGLPPDSNLVFDVRFLKNPYFEEDLRPLTGQDPRVSDYVLREEDAGRLLELVEQMLAFLLPRYANEGKAYLSVAIGCTGGRHRSVAIAEELGRRLSQERPVKVRHRDIER